MIKVGVVGVGYLGQHHARIYSGLPSCRLIGVADTSPGRAGEVAQKYGCRATSEARDLFSGVDCLSIAVPTPAHYEIARVALEAGLDVLIEKPICSRVAQAAKLVDLARRKKRILQVGHVERFNGAVERVIGQVKAPRFVEAMRLSPFGSRGMETSVVLELMIHDIDLVLSFVGEEPKEMEAIGVPVLSGEVDIANARLQFPSGCVANLTASRVSRERMRKIRVFQPDAYISLDYLKEEAAVYKRKPGVKLTTEEAVAKGLEGLVDFQLLKGDGEEPLKKELTSFLKAVETRARPVVSGEDGLSALKVALQVLEKMGAKGEALG
jgi:predicted dehydrogenase